MTSTRYDAKVYSDCKVEGDSQEDRRKSGDNGQEAAVVDELKGSGDVEVRV